MKRYLAADYDGAPFRLFGAPHLVSLAITLLVKQFQRLAERKIPVYWAAGRVDLPDRWPSAIPLPDNVHVFSTRSPETRKLDALKIQPQQLREHMRQRGLAHAGHVLDQQVAARQQAAEREVHLSILAEKDVVDRGLGLLQALQASIVIVHIPLPPRAASPFCRARV